MTKQTKILLGGLLLASTLSANDTLTQINFEQNSNGDMNPNIFLPIFWEDGLYSGVGYTSSTDKEISKLDSFSDSKNGIVTSSKDTKINWLTKDFGKFRVGLETNFIKTEQNEFGYIHDTANTFGNGNDYWIAFDNEVELDIQKTSIYLESSKHYGELFVRAGVNLDLNTNLKVKQNTLMKPLVATNGTSSSSTSQDFGYALKFEGYYDTKLLIKLGFEYDYNFAPTKYDIEQLGLSGATYIFEKATIDQDVTTTKYLGKIYVDKKVMSGFIPTIGFGKTSTKTKDNNGGSTTTKDENIFVVGFEKRF